MEFLHNKIVGANESEQLFLHQATAITEALCNLTYLIREDAEDPRQVRQYAAMSEERLQAMIDLLHSVETG